MPLVSVCASRCVLLRVPVLNSSAFLPFPATFTSRNLSTRFSGHSRPIGISVQALTENSHNFSVSMKFETEIGRESENWNNEKSWIHFVGIGGCRLSAPAVLAIKQIWY